MPRRPIAFLFFRNACLALAVLAAPMDSRAAPGDLDPLFGVLGRVEFDFGFPGGDEARAAVLQPDGKIVVAGSGTTSSAATFREIAVARLKNDGTLDNTFGTNGKAVLVFGPSDAGGAARGIERRPDGKLVLAGTVSFDGSYPSAVLARLNADGTLDGTFGTGGKVIMDLGAESRANALVLQPDNAIVIAGCALRTHGTDTYCDLLLARFDENGVPDPGFGTNGVAFAEFGAGKDSEAEALLRLPDGRFLAAGSTADVVAGGDRSFAFARFKSDGSIDNTFGPPKGTVGVPPVSGAHTSSARSLVLLPDNSAVAAGWVEDLAQGGIQAALIRIDAGGNTVPAFGTGGVRLLTFNGSFAFAYALLRQPDGKLVVAGTANVGSGQDFAFARLDSSGVLDGTFGTGGIVTHDGSAGGGSASTIAQQPDGKLVAAGKMSAFLAVLRLVNDAAGPVPPAGVISFQVASQRPNERDPALALIVVQRTGGSAGAVSVDWTTVPGSAAAGEDFAQDGGTLTWPDGDTTDRHIFLQITANDSPDCELPEETFTVELRNPTGGATLGAIPTETVIIESRVNPFCLGGGGAFGSGGSCSVAGAGGAFSEAMGSVGIWLAFPAWFIHRKVFRGRRNGTG